MTTTKTIITMRSSACILFIGAVALGVGSAQGQSSGQSFGQSVNQPAGQTMGAGASMPAMPSVASVPSTPVTSTTTTTTAGAAAPASTGPVIVSGPKDPTPSDLGARTVTRGPRFDSPPIANTSSAPKPGPTPFVPSQVEAVIPRIQSKVEHFPSAILHTTLGDITIRLFKTEAPHTVQNFLDLAKGEREFLDPKTSKKVHRPFYTGLIFHRVIKDFVIQTGCPFGTGRGDPGYNIPDEISPNLKHDKAGIVSMALAQNPKAGYEKNSNGSQFFITLTPQPSFDGKFTVFGEIIAGLDVAQRIGRVRTGPTDRPIKKVYLLSIDVNEPGPDLMQTLAVPTGVNLAMPLPVTNQNGLAGTSAAGTTAMASPPIPQMPPVKIPPMPASAGPGAPPTVSAPVSGVASAPVSAPVSGAAPVTAAGSGAKAMPQTTAPVPPVAGSMPGAAAGGPPTVSH